jgi:glycosyltransferase involved in cell wall biosynthesis
MSAHQILHILQDADRGHTAQARIIESLARWLDPQRYQQHVWFLGADGPLITRLEDAGLPARLVPWAGFRRDPLGAWPFLRAFRAGRFALVHQHLGGRSLRWLVQKTSNARVVLHLHARYAETPGGRRRPLDVRNADTVIAVSRAVADRVPGAEAVVIHPGIELPEETSLEQPATGRIVGTASRLVPAKGIEYLLRAVASLRAELPDLRLEIAGEGPARTSLEKEAQALGLGESVAFLGWQEDLQPVFRRWSVFALPSLEESFLLAALEAMAAGLPVVATAVGGTPEVIEDGRTGWLIPPADVGALTERLRALLLDPDECRRMGAAARARVQEQFSAQQMAAAVAAIYDRLLSDTRD